MIQGYDVSEAMRPACLHSRFQAFDAATTIA